VEDQHKLASLGLGTCQQLLRHKHQNCFATARSSQAVSIAIIAYSFTSSQLPIKPPSMASTTLRSLLSALPTDPSWAPPETKDSTLGGIPYAPYSKGDKLGRMADWTVEGKDRERGGQRQQYGNRYRGKIQISHDSC